MNLQNFKMADKAIFFYWNSLDKFYSKLHGAI